MEKIYFKNMYINIITGVLLLAVSVVGYFVGWIEDFLPIFVGVILGLLSIKRFLFSFKKIIGKNAVLVLIIEFFLDLVLVGLLIYLQDHIYLFIGLIIYIRGVAYLVINYIVKRKIRILQYLFNIGYLTLGCFLMFSSIDLDAIMILGISILLVVLGGLFLQKGLSTLSKKEQEEEQVEKELKQKQKSELQHMKEKQKAEIKGLESNEKSLKKIEKLEEKVKEVKEEQKVIAKENKELSKQLKVEEKKPEVKNNLDDKTVAELKQMAKDLDLKGYSSLNKSELIKKIEAVHPKK